MCLVLWRLDTPVKGGARQVRWFGSTLLEAKGRVDRVEGLWKATGKGDSI